MDAGKAYPIAVLLKSCINLCLELKLKDCVIQAIADPVSENIISSLYKYLSNPINYSVLVFTVKHSAFNKINFLEWLNGYKRVIIDSNNVLKSYVINELITSGVKVIAIGRGDL